MKKRASIILGFGLIALILSFLWYDEAHSPPLTKVGDDDVIPLVVHSPDGTVITLAVEIADEPDERRKGLMGREHLEDGHGMLFVFPQEDTLEFWMKDTLIPLDILYWDANGAFVSRTDMAPCGNDVPCPTYPSAGPAAYALEVNDGEPLVREVNKGWWIETK